MATALIAIDGSKHAEDAFKSYIDKFHRPGGKVLLLHCPEIYAYDMNMSPGRTTELQLQTKENTAKLQEKIKDIAEKFNVQYEWITCPSLNPGDTICKTATEKDVDYIITGSRGLGTIRRTILGSVSEFVVHHSNIPVLVCPNKGST